MSTELQDGDGPDRKKAKTNEYVKLVLFYISFSLTKLDRSRSWPLIWISEGTPDTANEGLAGPIRCVFRKPNNVSLCCILTLIWTLSNIHNQKSLSSPKLFRSREQAPNCQTGLNTDLARAKIRWFSRTCNKKIWKKNNPLNIEILLSDHFDYTATVLEIAKLYYYWMEHESVHFTCTRHRASLSTDYTPGTKY